MDHTQAAETHIYKPSREDHPLPQMVRLYCALDNAQWNLQVRGPLGTGLSGHRPGKDSVIATAHMSREDLLKLRDAINAALLPS